MARFGLAHAGRRIGRQRVIGAIENRKGCYKQRLPGRGTGEET